MKVAHLFSEEKFIDKHIIKYEDLHCGFSNDYYYLRARNNYNGINIQRVKYLEPRSEEYYDVVQNINRYDIVIVYFLQVEKARFVKDIENSKVVIIWSFYGADLYGLSFLKYQMLSESTKRALLLKRFGLNLFRVKEVLKKSISYISGKATADDQVRRACNRIDYFLWYNKFEYDFLCTQVDFPLPKFLLSTLNNRMENVVPKLTKSNSIVLGVSRVYFNNHIDAIKILKKCDYKGRISIPFSYGNYPRYSQKVKEAAQDSGLHIQFVEDFVPYEDYIEDLNSHSAAIYPSYRQMGLGNIFVAIRCGLKIYLCKQNPTLMWLRDKGMAIFCIEDDLEQDLMNDNLKISNDLIRLNNNIYSRMVDRKNDLLFFQQLKNIVQERN